MAGLVVQRQLYRWCVAGAHLCDLVHAPFLLVMVHAATRVDCIKTTRRCNRSFAAQDAPKNGAMFFELRTPGGTVAHAGLLEFTAPEGVALLPRDVAAALWGLGAEPSGPVTVTYTRLEKGTFVR